MPTEGGATISTTSTTLAPADSLLLPCYLVNNLTKNTEEQCKFVIDNDCLEEDGTFDYVYLVYCEMGYELRYAAIGAIVFLVIVLFLNLSSVADEFLCPSLLTVAKNLRMSDSLAGVTLLAFGNGCPDIFSSLAAASDNRPELIIGELLGAGIFCTSIVAGLVFINTGFKPAIRPLLRDGTFYLLAVCLVWYYCSQKAVTFYGSLAFILIYVIYLVVALGDQVIQSRLSGNYLMSEVHSGATRTSVPIADVNSFIWRRGSQVIVAETLNQPKNQTRGDRLQDIQSRAAGSKLHSAENISIELQLVKGDGCACNGFPIVRADEKGQLVAKLKNYVEFRRDQNSFGPTKLAEEKCPNSQEVDQRTGLTLEEWDNFLCQLNPIDSDGWSNMGLSGRLIQILRAPLLFVTTLTVPVVDSDKNNNNWCRLLNSLHCFSIPTALVSLTDLDMIMISFHASSSPTAWENACLAPLIKMALLLPGFVAAFVVFRKTRAFKAPKFHAVFAYVGFAMSVVWIYLLAKEIISLLKTVGIIFSMTDTAIGLGILAWGNSLGDIVANLSLAEAGYPRMALGASIGAPLLNLLLGFGLSFTLKLRPGQASPVEYTPTVTLLCSTLSIILIILMLSTLIPSNRSRKPFGYALISGYAIYFLFAICLEFGLIFEHPMKTE